MLRLQLLLLMCGTALAQLGFIHPPTRGPLSTLLVYRLNSEQRLEWKAQYSAYTIYLWQVLRDEKAVMLDPIFHTSNGTEHMFYDWTIDIPRETLHVSTLFYLVLPATDAAHFSASQNFVVSDSGVAQHSGDASPSATSSSMSTATLFTMSLLSSKARSSSSTTAEGHLGWADTSSSTLSKSQASSAATEPSSAVLSLPSSRTPGTLETTTAPPATRRTADANIAVVTGPAAAGMRSSQENDMGIWIGISLGLGLPLLATCAATAVWATRGRKRVLQL